MKMQFFAGLDPKSKEPLFMLDNPYPRNHRQARPTTIAVINGRHVRLPMRERRGVHLGKGPKAQPIAVRIFGGDAIDPSPLTRQVKRFRARTASIVVQA